MSVFVTSSTFLIFLEDSKRLFSSFLHNLPLKPLSCHVCTPKRVKQKAAGRWRLERQGVPHPCSRPASPAFNLAWHGCVYLSTGSGTAFILTTLVVVAFGWRSPVFGSILRRKGCLLRARHMHLRTWTTHRLPPSIAFASLHSNITILHSTSETICNQPRFILPYCPPIQLNSSLYPGFLNKTN